jgi:hypothetical protein
LRTETKFPRNLNHDRREIARQLPLPSVAKPHQRSWRFRNDNGYNESHVISDFNAALRHSRISW